MVLGLISESILQFTSLIIFMGVLYFRHTNILRCLNTHCILILNFYYIDAIFYYNYSAEGLGTLWRRDSFTVRLTFFARAFHFLCQSVFNVLPVLLQRTSMQKNFMLHEKKSLATSNKNSCFMTFKNIEHKIKKHLASDFFSCCNRFFSCSTVNNFSLDLSAISWLTDDNVSAKRS
jgi:hypothetical protein